MELYPLRGLEVGHQRLVIQELNQGGPLPQLVWHGPLPGNLFSLLHECRWELRAVAREWTTHGRHPLAKAIVTAIKMPPILATNQV
jgi:hypothetical protein